mmetsp:Transcript_25956/g.36777  ORF Transcript_25956/g.36777 Transcript_25956/m.36777 type:complete len:326 (+) Transcript_25956:561-1538(+)
MAGQTNQRPGQSKVLNASFLQYVVHDSGVVVTDHGILAHLRNDVLVPSKVGAVLKMAGERPSANHSNQNRFRGLRVGHPGKLTFLQLQNLQAAFACERGTHGQRKKPAFVRCKMRAVCLSGTGRQQVLVVTRAHFHTQNAVGLQVVCSVFKNFCAGFKGNGVKEPPHVDTVNQSFHGVGFDKTKCVGGKQLAIFFPQRVCVRFPLERSVAIDCEHYIAFARKKLGVPTVSASEVHNFERHFVGVVCLQISLPNVLGKRAGYGDFVGFLRVGVELFPERSVFVAFVHEKQQTSRKQSNAFRAKTKTLPEKNKNTDTLLSLFFFTLM